MSSSAPSIDAVAHVYARAIFEIAAGPEGSAVAVRGRLDEVDDELEQVVELTREDRGLREYINSPVIDKDARAAALRKIFGGRVSDLTLRFLLVLNRKNRLGHLASIQRAYDLMLHERFGRVEVDVFTAQPIAEEQVTTIKDLVHKALGKEPVMHRYVQPQMLGGIKLRIGDRLIDGSVAGRLQRMKESILSEGADALRGRLDKVLDQQ